MAVWTEYLGVYDAETKTFSALATSPYSPTKSGTLKELIVIISAASAASLTEHVQFKLTCTKWNPNTLYTWGQGPGLHTAPALGGALMTVTKANQPIQAGVPFTIEARNLTADTPVTVEVYLYATMEG